MRANPQLRTALGNQTIMTLLIRFFLALVVAIGVASVLVVSVVQKTREIGILRAMGVTRGQVLGEQRVEVLLGDFAEDVLRTISEHRGNAIAVIPRIDDGDAKRGKHMFHQERQCALGHGTCAQNDDSPSECAGQSHPPQLAARQPREAMLHSVGHGELPTDACWC